jgi:hypothetical protein
MIPLPVLEEIVDRSGIAPQIELLLPIGVRARQLLARTLLLGMLIVLADHRPAHLTRVHQALTTLPEDDQRRLGVLPGVEDADDSGAGDADGRKSQRPAGGCGGALWSVRCRWWSARCRCQSTTSLTAERVAVSSTRFLLAAKAATRDCRARLLTARG